jgi:hypothetical protein
VLRMRAQPSRHNGGGAESNRPAADLGRPKRMVTDVLRRRNLVSRCMDSPSPHIHPSSLVDSQVAEFVGDGSTYSHAFESMPGPRKHEEILREKVAKPHSWGANLIIINKLQATIFNENANVVKRNPFYDILGGLPSPPDQVARPVFKNAGTIFRTKGRGGIG